MINLENYKRGIIKGYELAYQDKNWYEKNKNNFSNSLKEKYPELIPNYAKTTEYQIKNYLGFTPDDLIRFGFLEKMELNVEGKSYEFWTVRMPKGFSMYHSSRALGLSHADFPLIGFKNKASTEENFTTSVTTCPIKKSVAKENVCTYALFSF